MLNSQTILDAGRVIGNKAAPPKPSALVLSMDNVEMTNRLCPTLQYFSSLLNIDVKQRADRLYLFGRDDALIAAIDLLRSLKVKLRQDLIATPFHPDWLNDHEDAGRLGIRRSHRLPSLYAPTVKEAEKRLPAYDSAPTPDIIAKMLESIDRYSEQNFSDEMSDYLCKNWTFSNKEAAELLLREVMDAHSKTVPNPERFKSNEIDTTAYAILQKFYAINGEVDSSMANKHYSQLNTEQNELKEASFLSEPNQETVNLALMNLIYLDTASELMKGIKEISLRYEDQAPFQSTLPYEAGGSYDPDAHLSSDQINHRTQSNNSAPLTELLRHLVEMVDLQKKLRLTRYAQVMLVKTASTLDKVSSKEALDLAIRDSLGLPVKKNHQPDSFLRY